MNTASAFAKKLDDFYAWKCPVSPNCSQLVKELADAVKQNPTDYASRLVLADALEDEGGHDQTAETQRHIAKRLSQFPLMMRASYGDMCALVEFMSQMESESLYLIMGLREHKIDHNRVCRRCGESELALRFNRITTCDVPGSGPVCSVIHVHRTHRPPMPLEIAELQPLIPTVVTSATSVADMEPFSTTTYHPYELRDMKGNYVWVYSGQTVSVINPNWYGTIVNEFQDWNR